MSSAAPRPASLARRMSQVYVSVPSSPYKDTRPSSRDDASTYNSPSTSSLKENTPLRPSRSNSDSTTLTTMSSLSSNSNKRKLSMTGERPEVVITTKPPAKKAKTSPTTSKAKQAEPREEPAPSNKAKALTGPPANKSEEFPDGHFYCHQCNKKRDTKLAIQCTKKHEVHGNVRRCKMRYCSACLKNRYGQDIEEKKSCTGSSLSKAKKAEHVSNAGYYWECPRCGNNCNCRVCRKHAGLPALGRVKLEKPPKELDSSVEKRKAKPKEKAITKAKGVTKTAVEKASKPRADGKGVVKPPPAPKVKAAPKPKPKPLPRPVWTRLDIPIPTEEVEDRIGIRQFVLRFANVLQVSTAHVDELEELIGETLSSVMEGDDTDLVAWVSESCAKSILTGLLDVIVGLASASHAIKQAGQIKEAIKNIRNSGGSLNKMWTALVALRSDTNVIGSDFRFNFPNPLPPPPTTIYRATRSGAGKVAASDVYVAHSAQLLPIISNLLELAIQSPAIREEIDNGVTAEKELSRQAREAINKEKEEWKEVKDTKKVKADLKANRERHKQRLHDLELSSFLASQHCSPRFGSLGRDSEGRVYYALSPGMAETDAAIQLIEGKVVKVKFGRRKGGITVEDRKEMQRWSWFLAVWGKKPEGADQALRGSDEERQDELMDDDVDRWWGFWDPVEIRKLAEWLEIRHGLSDDSARDKSSPKRSPANVNGARKSNGMRASRDTSVLSLSREPSPLSELSPEEIDESEEEDDQGEIPSFGKPTRKELSTLKYRLKEYAELLEWRVHRASASDGTSST